jgi:hypothetical protein
VEACGLSCMSIFPWVWEHEKHSVTRHVSSDVVHIDP